MIERLILSAHSDWQPILIKAFNQLCPEYLEQLLKQNDWLPGQSAILAAFSLPLAKTRYILLGESPYPRIQSANGYAFWDAAVNNIWSPSGLSKEVNRATSLRNLIKMLLFARGDLTSDFSQIAIAKVNKMRFWQTGAELFESFIEHGFLLLNASLVYSEGKVAYHAKYWRVFVVSILNQLIEQQSFIELVLLGRIAQLVQNETQHFKSIIAEHPFNLSFITNLNVVNFFKPFNLLEKPNAC